VRILRFKEEIFTRAGYPPPVLRIRILDPVLFLLLDPGLVPGWKKIQIQDQGSGMNIPELIFENLASVFGLKILKFFDADSGSCQP
jgi:hypothetical protein